MRLIGNNILVKPIEAKEVTGGGIVLISHEKGDLSLKGKVVMVGSKSDVRDGAIVYYDKNSNAIPIKYMGDSLFILNDGYVIAQD